MGYEVHQSHTLEDLLAVLARHLADDPLPPLATETILVPAAGIARWLQLRLAERFGIAAGIRMPFVGAFLQELQSAAAPLSVPFTREVLVWRLWRLLGDASPKGELGAAAAYCADDPNGEKRLQLCTTLAACFDDYQLYRDDLLLAFARGDDGKDAGSHGPWQAHLWRALLRDAGIGPPVQPRRGRPRPRDATPLLFRELEAGPSEPVPDAHRLEQLRALLRDPERARAALPPRLSVFGTATLPPAVVRLLQSIAAHVPVRLYVPAPTPHFFGDLRARDREGGNPLLARWGTEAREFADLLTDLESTPADGPPLERHDAAGAGDDAAAANLLQCLQQDIRDVVDRGAKDGPGKYVLRADDDSLRIHDCHSPQRELEVVRDQILAAFDQDDSLRPADVLVLVPDIERYAPYAHAVFGPVRDYLPFHVADRSPASDLPICACLLSVLELARSRLLAFDVLHLLEEQAVRRRFSFASGDVAALRRLCERAGIRWGLDAQSRQQRFGVPAFAENAWLPGLDRLLLGAVAGPGEELVAGILPAADVTEGRNDLLLRFVQFAQTLFRVLEPLQVAHTLQQWADLLDGLVGQLFAPDGAEDEAALHQLRLAGANLRRTAATARHEEPVGPTVLRDWLLGALHQGTGSRGFLAGSVTVAAMLPMRTVPVRHVYVCGLDDASFPRRDRPVPFDLIAAKHRPGDRSRRLDDRQVFLDVMLAARDRLHLCFVGHSAKDDSACAPSTVVAELREHVDRSCTAPAGAERASDTITVRHPLQPWSRRYRGGDDPRLFTFARKKEDEVGNLRPEAPWCGQLPPAAPVTGIEEIRLERLLEFWRHPCRFFLQHTLGIRVPREDDREDDSEPFTLNSLDKYFLQDEAVQRALRGEPSLRDPLALARAKGVLPIGTHGEAAFADVAAETDKFIDMAKQHHASGCPTVHVRGADYEIVGEIEGVGGDEVVHIHVAANKGKYMMRAWIFHLMAAVARAQGATGMPAKSRLITKDETCLAGPLEGAGALGHLDTLVRWFRLGRSQPLPSFERSSLAGAEMLAKGKDTAAALRAARGNWRPANNPELPWLRGDSEDPCNWLCMRGRDALADPFTELLESVWLPALAHLQVAK